MCVGSSPMSDIEVQAPPVVAVVVTKDPGPWLEETLMALAAQDYPELSVLVLDAASRHDPTARVAAVLPDAYVRRLPHDEGYAANANQVIDMVHGAPLYLFCHDDVAPDPDAVHQLVEEAFRSNAAVVAPKQVGWVDPVRLLHVGMAVDKAGAVVDRVLPLELDHGQHDAVRDVFVAPGGCTLVRSDLFAELGGYDPLVRVMGEDLDLCWRAQVAGARVVVAPAARVRHLELLAGGLRAAPPEEPARSLQELQRRHELYVVLKVYSTRHLLRVLPQVVVLSAAEVVVSLVTGHRQRARAVAGAWRWALRHRAAIRTGRAAIAASRRVPDRDVRRLQLRGSARLTSYVRRASTYGLHMAHLDAESMVADGQTIGVLPSAAGDATGGQGRSGGGSGTAAVGEQDGGTVGIGPEEAGDDWMAGSGERPTGEVLPGAGVPGDRDATGWGVPGTLSSRLLGVVSLAKADVPDLRAPSGSSAHRVEAGRDANRGLRARAAVWAVVAVVGLYGSRSLLSGGFPLVGQLLPVPAWSALWHQLVVGWHPASGIGATTASSPGLGELGVLATFLFGSVGLVQTVVVLGCIPLGCFGVWRLARPCGSPRARTVAAVVYAVLPVPYNDVATGHWQSLVVYAAAPWVLGLLSRSARLEPFVPSVPDRSGTAASAMAPRRWRHSPVGHMLALGLLDAAFAALAPQVLAVTVVVAFGVALGTVAMGGWGSARSAGRLLGVAAGGTVAALVLLAPWSVEVLAGGSWGRILFGAVPVAAVGPGLGALVRLSVGPVGDTPLAYGFAVAGFLPLLIGGRWRFAWATRLWSLVLVAWILAWACGRAWLGPVSLPVNALLVPAGLALALGAGLAVAAIEVDLPGYRFGWRQVASVVGVVAVVAGVLPVLGAAGNGRWDLPTQGWRAATAFMTGRQPTGQFRVLWIGNGALLPGPSWPVEPGLSATVTEGPTPDLTAVLTPPLARPLAPVAAALRRAQRDGTVQLGAVLAPYAIRYVVVAQSLAPTVLGYTSTVPSAAPSGVTSALERQIDLRSLSTESGYQIFADPSAAPERAVTTAGMPSPRAVLPGRSGADAFRGLVPAGTLRVSVNPPGSWVAVGAGGVALARVSSATSPAVAPAASYRVPSPQVVTVGYPGSWLHGLLLLGELVLSMAVAAALLGRRWWLDWWWRPLRRRWLAEGGRHRMGSSPVRSSQGAGQPPGRPEPSGPPGAEDL